MDYSLTEEQREWQSKARRFAQDEIRPLSLRLDQRPAPRDTFDWDIVRKGSKLGFRTLAVPKEWGGPGADFVTQALVMAELAKGDSAIAKTFSQNWKWSHLIAASCSQRQKERFLKPFLADDTYLLGRGITEPNAGSDNRLPPDDAPHAGFRLSARRDGDEWILNGEKCFIANGPVGALFFVDARTDPGADVRRGGTLFIVPRDTPGFRIGKVFDKSGWRFYQNAELIFENARVPHENVVGEVNGGGRASRGDTSGGDLFGDLELAANAVGVCDAAVELAAGQVSRRGRGGEPLLAHQIVQLKFHEMCMLTEALRTFVMRVASEHDRGQVTTAAGLALNFSCDVIQRVARLNMDLHDSRDGTLSARVDKLMRDAVIWTHTAGDSVLRLKTFRRLM